jgi:hypothetical protein
MDIQPLDILKWAGIGLAAGFIGYFGRYLAVLVLERIHKRQTQQTPIAEVTRETATAQEILLEESRLKLEKKRAKQEAKRAKKAGKK